MPQPAPRNGTAQPRRSSAQPPRAAAAVRGWRWHLPHEHPPRLCGGNAKGVRLRERGRAPGSGDAEGLRLPALPRARAERGCPVRAKQQHLRSRMLVLTNGQSKLLCQRTAQAAFFCFCERNKADIFTDMLAEGGLYPDFKETSACLGTQEYRERSSVQESLT